MRRGASFFLIAVLSCGSPRAPLGAKAPPSRIVASDAQSAPKQATAPQGPGVEPRDETAAEPPPPAEEEGSSEASIVESAHWVSGCRTRAQIASGFELTEQWMTGGPLGVVRVQVNDKLNARASASPLAKVVGQLAHDATEVRPTGNVCKLEGVSWYEVEFGGTTGWVNGRFVARVTPIHDFTAVYREFAPASAGSPEEFASRLVASFNKKYSKQPEGKYQSEALGVRALTSSAALVTVYSCCELDDAVAGEQVEIEVVKAQSGWVFQRARGRYVCYRGVEGDLCN